MSRDTLEPAGRRARRAAWFVVHAAVLTALLIIEAPLTRAYVRFRRWVGESDTRRIVSLPGETYRSASLSTTDADGTVRTRFVELGPRQRLDVSVTTKSPRSGWRLALKGLTGGEHYNFFEQMGVIYGGVFAAIMIWIYDRPRRRYVLAFAVAVAAAAAAVWFTQHTVGKLRIRDGEPVLQYLPFPRGWLQAAGLSFPSGHTTFAFVLGTFLAWAYPRAGWLFYASAALCGLSRAALLQHWISDVYAGGLLGWSATRGILRIAVTRGDRIVPRLPAWLRAAVSDPTA